MSVEAGFDLANVPLLPAWILVTEAAEILKVSKQAVHAMIRGGDFASIHKIRQSDGSYIYVLDREEVQDLAALRASRTIHRVPSPLAS